MSLSTASAVVGNVRNLASAVLLGLPSSFLPTTWVKVNELLIFRVNNSTPLRIDTRGDKG
jgi:hypothetical protein